MMSFLKQKLIEEYKSITGNSIQNVKNTFCKKFKFSPEGVIVTEYAKGTYKIKLTDDITITSYVGDSWISFYYPDVGAYNTIENREDLGRLLYHEVK